MMADEFTSFLTSCGFINDNFVARDCNVCFNLAMMTQVDELEKDRHLKANFVEFLEAFARAAERISMSPPKDEDNEENEKKTTIHQQADKESILLDGLSISEKAELVWKEYPRKLGKEKSINAIKRELKNRDYLEFIEIVRAFAKAKANTEKAFIPHGSTWFSNKGFNDDPEEWEDNKSKQSKPTTFTELTATAKSEQFSRNMQNPLY
jgi:hypothetical protein